MAEKNPALKNFRLTGKYASHETINELIHKMYRESLTTLLTEIKSNAQYYAIFMDETRDCAGHEQLSMCIRWVSADYVIHEDFIKMYDCPNTNAESITFAIKGMVQHADRGRRLCCEPRHVRSEILYCSAVLVIIKIRLNMRSVACYLSTARRDWNMLPGKKRQLQSGGSGVFFICVFFFPSLVFVLISQGYQLACCWRD